jgi:hypothetical protein
MTDFTYKTTALALQTRRLAGVSKKGGRWRAEPTDVGRYFAEHGAYPPGHWRSSNAVADTEDAAHADRTPPQGRSAPSRVVAARRVSGLRPVDQLLADVAAAGGELHVTRERGGYYENLVSSAMRHGKVADGKLLEVINGRRWADQIVRLVDPPGWMTAVLDPIMVSDHLRNPHPVVKALREDKDRLNMKPPVRSRALRILDALAKAAVRHGHTMNPAEAQHGYRFPKGHLRIGIGGHDFTICVDELNDRVPHVPTAAELRDKARYSWARIPTHDSVPSGRLRLQILEGWAVRQEKFTDTKTIDLVDRLAVVLQEVGLRAAAAEERRRQRERKEAERERQWKQVLERAEIQLRDHHRGETLMEQVERWQQAQHLDDYINAMTTRAASLTGSEREAAEEWVLWAREYRQGIDPLNEPFALPPDPDFSAEALKPFMRGWSPNGPHRALGW